MSLLRRTMGAISRRSGRPELLAAMYADAKQALREEIGISAILASALAGDGTYVDVGANRGQILREAVRVAPRGHHLAFEPIPALATSLAVAFPTVDCRQLALGARPEAAQFCHFRGLDGWSGLRRNPEISDEQGDPEYIGVNISTLDIELAGLAPRVLKIDVEGAELDVIEGARELLSYVKPLVIFEHVSAAAALYGAEDTVWELLRELDYDVFSASGDGPFSRRAFADSRKVVNWLARPMSVVGARAIRG